MASHTFDLMKKLKMLFDPIFYGPFLKRQSKLQKFIESPSQERPSIIKGIPGKSGPTNCFNSCSGGNHLPDPLWSLVEKVN